jgi:hypothetical protein
MEANFTRKVLKAAMQKLKTKYWKSTGLDGIRSWMIDKAEEGFLEFLLEFYNTCWEKGEIPTNWYETLITYIYKNKGKLQGLHHTDLLPSLVCLPTYSRLCGYTDWCP